MAASAEPQQRARGVLRRRSATGDRRRRTAARNRRWRQRLRNPPGRWLLLTFCLLAILVVVMFQGFATHTVGSTSEPLGSANAPLRHAGAILKPRGERLVSAGPAPGRRIALTFDDGPNARWTLPIARQLHRLGVPGTFFEVGSQVARYPNIVHQLIAYGDELGNHTFTHVLLPTVPVWEQRLQIEWTEAAIAGVTGHYTRLVRPPYSATPKAVTARDERAYARLLGRPYYLVLANWDSQDWMRPGVEAIVRNATPPGRAGGIIMMHDGGGDRSQTLRALPILIERLRQRGYRFVTVSQIAGISRAAAMPAVAGWTHTRGEAFVFSVHAAYILTTTTAVVLLVIAGLVVLRSLLLFAFATYQYRMTRGASTASDAEYLPDAVIVVPAYNEEVNIERTVRSLAASDYPDVRIVVVDDGSSDGTASIVAGLELPNVVLVRQDNTGKAAALQTGVEVSDAEVIAMVDADTQFEPGTLRALVQPLRDPNVAAVSGNTKVGNRHGILGLWQHLEYVIGFNLDRRMYDALRCMPTIPGAVGAFRRDALAEVGGVPGDTIAEDTDLTLAIGRTGKRVAYVEDARAWTEAPSTLATLWRQRYRWSFGTIQAVWKHRRAFFSLDRRQRRIGWITLPFLTLFHILLPLMAPLIDVFALYGLLFIGAGFTLAVWGAFNLLQVVTAAYGLWMDGEPLHTVWAVPLQQFVYRQLMYLVIIETFITALQGARTRWGHLPRTGDAVVGAS